MCEKRLDIICIFYIVVKTRNQLMKTKFVFVLPKGAGENTQIRFNCNLVGDNY